SLTEDCGCPALMRESTTVANLCVPETCGTNDIRDDDENCETCPGELIVDGNVCKCPVNQRLEDGTTDMCEIPPACMNDLERVDPESPCACPSTMKATRADATMCVPITCGARQIRLSDATEACMTCTDDLGPNPARNMCVCSDNTMRPIAPGATTCEIPPACMNDLERANPLAECACLPGMQPTAADDTMCEPIPANDDEIENAEYAIGIGAASFVGLIVYNYYIGGPGIWDYFGFAPTYNFSHSGGGSVYSAGARLEYAREDFSAFWGAKRAPNNGNVIYTSGMKFAKDYWTVAYNAEAENESAAYNLSAGVQIKDGIFAYKSGIAGEYIAEEETDDFSAGWQNAVELNYQGWKITPIANIYWGETTATDFRLNLQYRF
ncbi:MAG: hypothetical protein ACR2P5_00255, partial [Gammaproteobacteria bacterium]